MKSQSNSALLTVASFSQSPTEGPENLLTRPSFELVMRFELANFAFILLIITAIINHSDVPFLFYGVTAAAAGFLLLLYLKKESTLRLPKTPTLLLLIIFVVYIYHIPNYILNLDGIIRIGVTIVIGPILLFIIPRLIAKRAFLIITAVTATGFVLIGLPSAVLGEYSFFSFESTTRGEHPLLGIYRIESISTTTVSSGYIAFIGMISSLAIRSTLFRNSTFLICSAGVVLPHSRAAYVAALASISIILLFLYLREEYVMPVISATFVIGSILFLSFMRVLPTPEILHIVRTAGRDEIFQAGVEAFLSQPILGNGPAEMSELVQQFTDRHSVGAGTYNQFLRMFISTGIIGGLSYLILIVSPMMKFSAKDVDWNSIVIYALFIGIFVNELFTGRGIFGLSHSSIVAAISLGYIFQNIYFE